MTESQPVTHKGLALALLAAAQFVVVLDASIVNVALPSIGRDLNFSQENLSWVVNAYTLVFGGFLLLGGRMADLLGRRRVFTVGLIVFALASLLGGFASSEGQLIAARALQGLGAAILSPAALSILTTTFAEGAERNRALGVWGAVAGSGGAVGVLLGGVLTEYLGWEWVLFVNVPIALFAAAMTSRLLPESRETGPRRYDVAGAVSITAGISLLVYALVDAVNEGWGSTQTLGLIAISLALVAAFVVIELRSSHPLISFAIFRKRTLTGANIVAVLVAMSLFSMFFFVSLYMQQVLGYDALKAGVAYLPLAGGIILSAGVASQLVTKVGFKPVMVVGFVLDRRRPDLVRPGLAQRHLRGRRAVPVAAGRRRPRARVRAADDRRGRRGLRAGVRARERADQHLPAGRRRARPRHPRVDRELDHERRDGRSPR